MPENARILGLNILRLMDEKGIERMELAEALGVKYSTLSSWINGDNFPRIQRIQEMADFFGCDKSELIEPPKESHYINPEAEQVAQEIMENHDLKLLFDAARDIPPEELKLIHSMALALKKKENHEE